MERKASFAEKYKTTVIRKDLLNRMKIHVARECLKQNKNISVKEKIETILDDFLQENGEK